MIISCKNSEYRIDFITQEVTKLILSGVSSDKILILCLNSFKKSKLLSAINESLLKNNVSATAQINVSTFGGIVYNSIVKNWVNIENVLDKNDNNCEVFPTLSGLDVSQYFLQKIVKEEDFQDYFSKKNLMHQLLRRYKLIVENDLTNEELEAKSKILNETFSENAHFAINSYKKLSSKNRIFDNLKQISSFLYLLKHNQINDFNKIEYFFTDDTDEFSFAAFEFCKYIISKAKKNYILLNKDGCCRKGYLCGYDNIFNELSEQMEVKEIKSDLIPEQDANILTQNILNRTANSLAHFKTFQYSKRLEMIEACATKIDELIKNGVEPAKIQIITPLTDDNLVCSFNEFFKKHNIKVQLLTGNKAIVDDIYVYAIITILSLLNNIQINTFDIRILLNNILQIPIYECEKFIAHYAKTGTLPQSNENKFISYNNLYNLLNNNDCLNTSLTQQFEMIFSQIIAPNIQSEIDFEPINLLLKSIQEFEKIKVNFKKFENIELSINDWLLHTKNSIVSQNPSQSAHIKNDAVIISTAQKIVDFSLPAQYQFWLDVSSQEWLKEDTGTIYNAWVFQKNYKQADFTPELNKQLTYEKTAKLLSKLTLCAENTIFAYSSLYDVTGRENYGELANFITENQDTQNKFKFIPRDDQAKILEYSSGKLAVPAVPGAGKTTVMLALLTELVKKGTDPQSILVLTFMDSAAKNFLSRYKQIFPQRTKLPHISTIHSFAFKMIMENNNYAYLNLPEEFSICDDTLKMSIIKEICALNLPIGENIDDYSNLMLAAIGKAKLNQLTVYDLKDKADVAEFTHIFALYQTKLRDLSLLDYDDLLINAVKLLNENSEIAEYYQNKFKYIIEDEAQDSTKIQQTLINILSKKYNNVIRCGDVNQAILGTFSNSDLSGFKNFIKDNEKIEMYRSQRCTEDIYQLANMLIDKSKENTITQDAFYDLKMSGVEGKNPITAHAINYHIFETQSNEKEFVLNDIREVLSSDPNSPTFAILVRTNKQVSEWASYIENQGLKTICRGNSYKQKKIFNFILSVMELFFTPWSNKNAATFYKELCKIEKFKFDKNLYSYIEKYNGVFLHPETIKDKTFPNNDLEKFWWEAFAVIERKTLNIQEIIIYCANNYFEDITDKSNAYLFSILVKRYTNTLSGDEKFQLNYIPEIIKYFKQLLSQKVLKGINLFTKEDEEQNFGGFVQIMTIHKSKGAEFDYVYMPEFTDFNYSLNFAKCCERIKKNKKPLLSKLDKIITNKEIMPTQTAKEEINETLRLIYVAITRAKLKLTFSYSEKNQFNRNNNPVAIIEELCTKQKNSAVIYTQFSEQL